MSKIFKYIGIIVVAFIALGILGAIFGGNNKSTNNTTDKSSSNTTSNNEVVKKDENKPKLTLETFNKLLSNSSLSEVESLIGKGELQSENAIAGITTKMYTFKGESFGSNASIMFQDDKMMSKTQFGLK